MGNTEHLAGIFRIRAQVVSTVSPPGRKSRTPYIQIAPEDRKKGAEKAGHRNTFIVSSDF